MTKRELKKAMAKYGESLDDITAIYVIGEGVIQLSDKMPPWDIYVFTDNFTYIVAQYDGNYWFEGVPNKLSAARNIEEYGEYGDG